ncbi:5-(carboxyamino)imidazole ribonucleotide synthase [Bacillus sp. FJAT-45037]|uniref:5-(carboxyamino)imidazole ribonucleotide synthase n=1 Tax=Bacillus sp. FJAT-45037 TaxID=2011007 RepID=UPI000C234D38|nr:5-(carboxyamino)imidazole ribonucleotide synthase [Bacillus sp. FJAT-45037]
MKQVINPGSTIGIIGGGQLGRMLAIAARQMGYKIVVLEPSENSPCQGVADEMITASYDDQLAAKKLAQLADVITYEFENIDKNTAQLLTEIAYFPQGYELLGITQHRLREKEAITAIGVEVAPYKAIASINDCQDAAREIGFPAVLKTCQGGYDGKGQAVVHNETDLLQATRQLLGETELVLEGWVPFSCELSVIVTRSTKGETKTFPAAENVHVNNILHQSIVPARVSDAVLEQAEKIALKLADELGLVGILAIEMFVTEDGKVLVNELAPRPHNSGHYTIEGCETSQFEQQIRAICGWPLGSTNFHQATVMENILGQHIEDVLHSVEKLGEVKLHLYGKKEAKQNRKMGHLTATGVTVDVALEKLQRIPERMC